MQTETQLQNDDQTEAFHTDPRQLRSRRYAYISLVTRFLAAQIILQPDFPNRANMPRISPPDFSNLGHQIFVDYNLLVNYVWKTALEVKNAVSGYSRIHSVWVIALVLAIFPGSLLLAVSPSSMGLIYAVLAILYCFIRRQGSIVRRKASRIRSEAVNRLLSDSKIDTERVVNISAVGDGSLGTENIPVLIAMQPGRQFPGYGRLLFENQFVCRPKEDSAEDVRMTKYEETVDSTHNKLTQHFSSGWSDVQFGEVVVVSGSSLQLDSAWLDRNKAPHLWVPRSELTRLSSIDPRVSVRQFFAIQIPLYEFGTIATFFLRLFVAGNSIAFDVSLLTLGPPIVSLEALHASRLKTQRNITPGMHFFSSLIHGMRLFWHSWGQGPSNREAINHLDKILNAGKFEHGFQGNIDLRALRWIDPQIEAKKSIEQIDKAQRISSKSQIWPLRYHPTFSDWREVNSLSLPNGSFLRPEVLAVLRTAYDQVVRVTLENLNSCGYDISDYRDKDGKFTIKAEQIEQLIVGENVKIQTGDKTKKTSEKSAA